MARDQETFFSNEDKDELRRRNASYHPEGKCWCTWCGFECDPMQWDSLRADHTIPISQGEEWHFLDNGAILRTACDQNKGAGDRHQPASSRPAAPATDATPRAPRRTST